MPARQIIARLLLACFPLLLLPAPASSHGSVTPDDDLCIIRIGYYRAHFKIYLPRAKGHTEYCEDIPAVGETLFVMEYEHSGLGDVPLDFRVIRNVTGQGVFASLQDVNDIVDLDAVTVLHRPAAVTADVFTVLHHFAEAGDYIGIVSAGQAGSDKIHTAVFPFEVGFTGLGWWPWFAGIAVLLQLNYLWMNGWFSRQGRETSQPQEDGGSS